MVAGFNTSNVPSLRGGQPDQVQRMRLSLCRPIRTGAPRKESLIGLNSFRGNRVQRFGKIESGNFAITLSGSRILKKAVEFARTPLAHIFVRLFGKVPSSGHRLKAGGNPNIGISSENHIVPFCGVPLTISQVGRPGKISISPSHRALCKIRTRLFVTI